jgi:hypothetical protein
MDIQSQILAKDRLSNVAIKSLILISEIEYRFEFSEIQISSLSDLNEKKLKTNNK